VRRVHLGLFALAKEVVVEAGFQAKASLQRTGGVFVSRLNRPWRQGKEAYEST
jgi:hypothetical protein